jgi:hypothetical protein
MALNFTPPTAEQVCGESYDALGLVVLTGRRLFLVSFDGQIAAALGPEEKEVRLLQMHPTIESYCVSTTCAMFLLNVGFRTQGSLVIGRGTKGSCCGFVWCLHVLLLFANARLDVQLFPPIPIPEVSVY